MNKRCCCAGRLRAYHLLKSKINSWIKKTFYQPIRNLSSKSFFPNKTIKRGSQRQKAVHHTPRTRVKTTTGLSTNQHPYNILNQPELDHSQKAYQTKNELAPDHFLTGSRERKYTIPYWVYEFHTTQSVYFTINKFNSKILSFKIFFNTMHLSITILYVMHIQYVKNSWIMILFPLEVRCQVFIANWTYAHRIKFGL